MARALLPRQGEGTGGKNAQPDPAWLLPRGCSCPRSKPRLHTLARSGRKGGCLHLLGTPGCVPWAPGTWARGPGVERRAKQPSPSQDHTGNVTSGDPPCPTPRGPKSFDAVARGAVSEHSQASPPLQMLAVPGVPEPPRVRAAAPSQGLAPRRMSQRPASSRLHHE